MAWFGAFLLVPIYAFASSKTYNVRRAEDQPHVNCITAIKSVSNIPYLFDSNSIRLIQTEADWNVAKLSAECQGLPIVIIGRSHLTAYYEALANQYREVVFCCGTSEVLQRLGHFRRNVIVFFQCQKYVCAIENLASLLHFTTAAYGNKYTALKKSQNERQKQYELRVRNDFLC